MKNSCQELERKSSVTTYEIDPVCRCNNKTNVNSSITECSGIDDFTLGACSAVGRWKLIAILSDPGNGSGKFVDIISEKTIEFKEG